jgi:hypothetical protein
MGCLKKTHILLFSEVIILFKKILGLLLVLILTVSSTVYAQSDDYYFSCEVGDICLTGDIMSSIGDPTWVYKSDLNNALRNSQLFVYTGNIINHPRDLYFRAIKVGEQDVQMNYNWPLDPDTIHFTVKPHPMVLNSYYDPFIDSDGLLHGNVNPRAANPDKSHPDYFEFNNCGYVVTCYSNDSNIWNQTIFKTGDTPASRAGSINNGFFQFSDLDWHLDHNTSYNLKVDLIYRGNWSTASKSWNINT